MAKKLAYDKVLFAVVIVLVGLGLTMVFSSSAAFARDQGYSYNMFLVKQGLAATLGLLLMWLAMHIDYRMLGRPPVLYTLVGGALLLLVGVLFGPQINGTHRWLLVGNFSLQPSEWAKLVLVAWVAYQIAKERPVEEQGKLVVSCGLLLGLLAILILLEPDLGTAVLLCATLTAMLFLAGLRWRFFLVGGLALLPLLAILIVTAEYRLKRLLVFLNPNLDPLGAGYQARQSLIAVGSGGVSGVGLGDSLQKLYYLPHPHSDFIYSIIAEELGMLGALGVVGLFGVLLWRGVVAGLRAPDVFGRYLAWGLSAMLVLQALIHVSVALALLPTKGIPLPYISYGGSSLMVCMAAGGLILNVSQHG